MKTSLTCGLLVAFAFHPLASIAAGDAKYFGLDLPQEIPMTTQDRAYTSPIWYTPG